MPVEITLAVRAMLDTVVFRRLRAAARRFSGAIETGFMRVVGFPTMDFKSSSTSAWGNVRMRVAMVLDVTGSMANSGKMAAMQKAAKALVDQLSLLAKNPGDMYISMVPFAKDVNLGTSYKDETWIDWSLWDTQSATNT